MFSPRLFRALNPILWGIAVLAFAAPVRAQESTEPSAPPHVLYIDGAASLERDGQLESLTVSMPVVAGDRLRTSAGRLEILFPDGSALDLDENSEVEMLAPTLLRVSSGRAILAVAGASDPSRAGRYQIDTPAASVQTGGPGEFRVTAWNARGEETELAVARGVARLINERGSVDVRAGEMSIAHSDIAPARTSVFNSARLDPFDRWVADRRNARVAAATPYLPRELQAYGGVLDRSGSWQYNNPYGYVWYPSVAADWRPYYEGYWTSVPSYGWTWVGLNSWTWPTHHYGRWGYGRGSWFWIPGRSWAPAWVSWAAASDYVSWCPLGFDGRPVFALSIGESTPWPGWTFLPRRTFGDRGYRVDRYALAPHQVPRTTPFIINSAPAAVARRSRPADGAGTGRRSAAADRNPTSNVGSDRPNIAIPRNTGRSTPESAGSRPEFRQPLPDSYRRRQPDAVTAAPPRNEPRADNTPVERAVPRYRTRETPAVNAPTASAPTPDAPAERAVPRYRTRETPPNTPTASAPASDVPVERQTPRYRTRETPPSAAPTARPTPGGAPPSAPAPNAPAASAPSAPTFRRGPERPAAPPPAAEHPAEASEGRHEGNSDRERAVPRGEASGDRAPSARRR